jgi:ribosomal protein S18 acetylase RimI-like enzyme
MQEIRDKAEIWSRLQREASLHLYEIGDLDEFFWPHTRWFAGAEQSLALLYTGMTPPTLLAFEGTPSDSMLDLVEELASSLPDEIYSHLSPHLEEVLLGHYESRSRGEHQKMVLSRGSLATDIDTSACHTLHPDSLPEVEAFYQEAYPDNWFDPRMLETGAYVGLREEGKLLCIAGVHVYSAEYQVAALGNIATLPSERGRGLARRCTAACCERLFQEVEIIGLNVSRDNAAALACYHSLGFQKVADYNEVGLRKRS